MDGQLDNGELEAATLKLIVRMERLAEEEPKDLDKSETVVERFWGVSLSDTDS